MFIFQTSFGSRADNSRADFTWQYVTERKKVAYLFIHGPTSTWHVSPSQFCLRCPERRFWSTSTWGMRLRGSICSRPHGNRRKSCQGI